MYFPYLLTNVNKDDARSILKIRSFIPRKMLHFTELFAYHVIFYAYVEIVPAQ